MQVAQVMVDPRDLERARIRSLSRRPNPTPISTEILCPAKFSLLQAPPAPQRPQANMLFFRNVDLGPRLSSATSCGILGQSPKLWAVFPQCRADRIVLHFRVPLPVTSSEVKYLLDHMLHY